MTNKPNFQNLIVQANADKANLEELIKSVTKGLGTRERDKTVTKLQEAFFWLSQDTATLKRLEVQSNKPKIITAKR